MHPLRVLKHTLDAFWDELMGSFGLLLLVGFSLQKDQLNVSKQVYTEFIP